MNIDNLPFSRDNGRHTIKTTRLKRSLSKFVDKQLSAYLGYDSLSRAVKFVLELLDKVDTDKLDTTVESYMNYGKSYIENIEFLIDPVRNGPSRLPHFIEADDVSEIITPVESSSTVSYMKATWVEEFLDDQVLTIISHDSSELPYDTVYDGLIRFEHDDPTHVLIGINVDALVAKYINWINTTDEEELDYESFVKREILHTRYRDLIDVYVISLIRDTMNNTEPVFNKRNTSVPATTVNYALPEIKELFESVSKNSISLSAFMSTMFLVNDSVLSRYEKLDREMKLSTITKFTPIRLIKALPALEIIIRLLSSSDKVLKNNRSLITTLRREFRVLSRSKWENHIHSPLAKSQIDLLLTEMETLLI